MTDERVRVSDAAVAVGSRRHPRTLWSGLNLSVHAGECVCITGPSGSGKSTLLNCIGLLDRLSSGTLHLNGQNVTDASEFQRLRLRRRMLGYLFQGYALIDNDTVEANVKLAAPSPRHSSSLCAEALAAVGLQDREGARVYELSGGEQQRVAMARLLVRTPSIVLADEPTASLDRTNATRILTHLQTCADNGAAVIIVSHDPWVMDHCDRREELHAHV